MRRAARSRGAGAHFTCERISQIIADMEKLRGLEMVVRAADAGSFSKAARSLGVTPSAVSHAVADLEKQLRVSIFYRTTRQLRLTEDGQAIYGRGREILDRLNELESTVARPSERLRGTLRVGLSVSLSRIIVMPAIAQFSLRHPDLRLNMVVLTQPREMHAEGVDLMLRVGDPPESGLIARRIARIRYASTRLPNTWTAREPRQSRATCYVTPAWCFAIQPGSCSTNGFSSAAANASL